MGLGVRIKSAFSGGSPILLLNYLVHKMYPIKRIIYQKNNIVSFIKNEHFLNLETKINYVDLKSDNERMNY